MWCLPHLQIGLKGKGFLNFAGIPAQTPNGINNGSIAVLSATTITTTITTHNEILGKGVSTPDTTTAQQQAQGNIIIVNYGKGIPIPLRNDFEGVLTPNPYGYCVKGEREKDL